MKPRWRRPPAFVWWFQASLKRRLFTALGMAVAVGGGLGYALHAWLAPSAVALPVALLCATAVLWMAAGVMAWGVTRPLMELASVARDLGEGKLDRRMKLSRFGAESRRERGRHGHRGPGHGRGHGHGHRWHGRRHHHGEHPNELTILANVVNDMAERIEAQVEGQRELLASVSHELRTPLGHMRVLIDTARDGEGAPGPVFDELEREVVELDDLVDQLLAHSRLEFERVESRRLDPVSVALRALERVGADASKLELEWRAGRDEGAALPTIEGDPTLLGRALANLLANARSHGHGLTALRVYEDSLDSGPALAFGVEDRGPGFAEGELEGVFESFVQGRAHEGGSLGLGLSLVARIARAHGGEARASNREGGGARVSLLLPLR